MEENLNPVESTEQPEVKEEVSSVTMDALVAEIKELKDALKASNEKHESEMANLIKSFTGKPKEKTEFEKQVDTATENINKYRGGIR